MTDYYSELNIDKHSSIEDIKAELDRQERQWIQRQIAKPEEATKKLAIIIDARKAFASDSSRREYDNELERSQRNVDLDPNELKKAETRKWTDQARNYLYENQNDLAKAAVEKALSCGTTDDDVLFDLAAEIYRVNGNLHIAMDYVNKAIVLFPEKGAYYLTKGLIFDSILNNSTIDRRQYPIELCVQKATELFRLAAEKAEKNGDNYTRANALGILACVLYFDTRYMYPGSKDEAERIVSVVKSLGWDTWGNAKKVDKDIENKKAAEEIKRQDEERKRIEDIYERAVKQSENDSSYLLVGTSQAADLFDSIRQYRDSESRAKACRQKVKDREQQIKKEEEEKKRQFEKKKANEKRLKKLRKTVAIIIAGVIVMAIVFAVLKDNSSRKNKYNEALVKIENQEYQEAYGLLNNLNYKDSSDVANNVVYLWAKQLYENKEYDEAARKFKQIRYEYEDCEELYYKAMYDYVQENINISNDYTKEEFLSDLKDADYLDCKALFYSKMYYVDININENENDNDVDLDTVNWSEGDAIYAHYVVHYKGSMSRYSSEEINVYGKFVGSGWSGKDYEMTCKPEDEMWMNIFWDSGNHPNSGNAVFKLYTKDGDQVIGEKGFNIILE